MADGSELIVRGPVLLAQGPNAKRLAEVSPAQVIVACCDSCNAVGEVDKNLWRLPYEQAMFVSTLARQLRCIPCGCKSVALQLWPVTPYPAEPRRPAFQRWR